jgi:hypothetical protein
MGDDMPTRKVTKAARSRRTVAAKKKPAAKEKRTVARVGAKKPASKPAKKAAKAAAKKPAARAKPSRKRAASKKTPPRGVIGRVVKTVRDAMTVAIAAVTPAGDTTARPAGRAPEHPLERDEPSPDVS